MAASLFYLLSADSKGPSAEAARSFERSFGKARTDARDSEDPGPERRNRKSSLGGRIRAAHKADSNGQARSCAMRRGKANEV